MNKHLDSQTLRLYFDIKNRRCALPVSEQEAITSLVDEHIKSCNKCLTRFHTAESFHKNEKKYAAKSKKRTSTLYTGTFLIAMLIVLYTQLWDTEINKQPIYSNNEIIKKYILSKEKGNDLSLLAFSEKNNFDLEPSFYEDESQEIEVEESFTRTLGEITDITPNNLMILETPIKFSWRGTSNNISIVIKDNKNQIVWEGTANSMNSITCSNNLEPGVFYWELKADNEIVTKRKYFIVN